MKSFTYIIACVLCILFFLPQCSDKERSTEHNDSSMTDSVNIKEMSSNTELKKGTYSNARIHVNYFGSFREVFNDSNKYQYVYAEKLGIDPIVSVKNSYFTKRPLIKIESNKFYHVDKLTHSLPFLVPEAAKLLEDIGKNFIDSLARRGADGYRIKVTSLLRTPSTVKRLRRVNVNASDSSAHQFGTTFDISYNHFFCLDSTRTINGNDLKGVLGEVLLDLRKQERCLVKYEYKTACFHITATK